MHQGINSVTLAAGRHKRATWIRGKMVTEIEEDDEGYIDKVAYPDADYAYGTKRPEGDGWHRVDNFPVDPEADARYQQMLDEIHG